MKYLINLKGKEEYDSIFMQTFEEYIDYVKKMPLKQLKEEATFLKNYFEVLNKTYNGLIDLIRDDIVISIMDELYFNPNNVDKKYMLNKLSLLENYLNTEVYHFFNKGNDEKNDEICSDFIELDEKELYEIIIQKYSLIYAKREKNNQNSLFEYVITYKGMDYSLFDALTNLYNELTLKVEFYVEKLQKVDENNVIEFANDFITNITSVTEKYCEHYIDITPKFKEILDEDKFSILLKYNCLNTLKEMVTLPPLIGLDLKDVLDFINNSSIVKIINGKQEIVLSDLKTNKLILSGLNDCNTMIDVMNKVKAYSEGCLEGSEYLLGNSTNFLAIYLLDKR